MTAIRAMAPSDWTMVEAIFANGIEGGEATFETRTPAWAQFDSGKIREPRLVAVDDGEVVGWAAASHISSREVYRGVIEHCTCIPPCAGAAWEGRCSRRSSPDRTRQDIG